MGWMKGKEVSREEDRFLSTYYTDGDICVFSLQISDGTHNAYKLMLVTLDKISLQELSPSLLNLTALLYMGQIITTTQGGFQ